MTHGARGLRWHTLVVLTAAVVALHWMALKAVAPVFAPGRTAKAADFQARVVQQEPTRDVERQGAATVPLEPAPPPAAVATRTASPRVVRDASASGASDATSTTTPSSAAPGVLTDGPGLSSPAEQPSPASSSAPPVRTSISPAPTLAAALAGSATFHYRARSRLRGTEVEGHAVLRWQQDGSNYDAMLELSLPGRPTRTQRSTGAITAQGLSPLRYSDRSRSEEAAHFDRAGQRIVFSTNRPGASLQPGAQDRLSVLLQLSAWAAGSNAAFTPGRSVLVQTASAREALGWMFAIESADMLDLPGGTVQAMRLTRAPLHEHDGLLELWLGPGPAYAPVRLRLTAPGGDWLDLQWSGTDRG